MATTNPKELSIDQQQEIPTGYGEVHGLCDDALLALRVAERMSFLTADVLNALRMGETPERIKEMVTVLHSNLVSLSSCSNRALYVHGFYLQDNTVEE
jgi:hypothetical protein